jgi:hypothetical protein
MKSEHSYVFHHGQLTLKVSINYTYVKAEHGFAPSGSWHTPGDINVHEVWVEEVWGWVTGGADAYRMSRDDIGVGWLWDLEIYATQRVLDEIDDWSCLADELVENA